MDLFGDSLAEPINILPYDGEVDYYGTLLPTDMADKYFQLLLNKVQWQHDEAVIYGKKIVTARKVAWYAKQAFSYTYSNTTKHALPWLDELEPLKAMVEEKTAETFNSCLLNLYHSGAEGMAWHSDGEMDLKKNGAIASLTLGAKRKFAFKHKQSKETVSLALDHGSLLVMKGVTQTHWLHRLPPTKKVTEPRINLTFRTIVK
ncbi:alpha-ketoglutarate-dependent dioxygenase AlkB family protein [Thalassotalea sp. PLHSN55]|uniref:alpha-ketoglutarate-dependent dioxygenase AlkB family protein n=1 Tax=Thalassotalea sp. PLHSN55 TaxID=3435888 RepID=UPI003F87EEC1